MKIRNQIKNTFDGKAFERPLFYAYKGGLRFELSEGGHYLNQFLTAHRKGSEICDVIFDENSTVSVCIKFYGTNNLLSSLSLFRAFKEAGIVIPKAREYWSEYNEDEECFEENQISRWHYVAFQVPNEMLNILLWCSFATDCIQPNPGAMIYLFNFDKQIMVWPYDDRGMDVVGKNHKFLKELYNEFNDYLLDYDRETIDKVFGIDL